MLTRLQQLAGIKLNEITINHNPTFKNNKILLKYIQDNIEFKKELLILVFKSMGIYDDPDIYNNWDYVKKGWNKDKGIIQDNVVLLDDQEEDLLFLSIDKNFPEYNNDLEIRSFKLKNNKQLYFQYY